MASVRLSSKDHPTREQDLETMAKRRTSNKTLVLQALTDLILSFEKKNGRLPLWDCAEIVELERPKNPKR